MTSAIFNWSGGKDSALALHKILTSTNYKVSTLLTCVSQEFQRISMHGVRVELLKQQADSIGLPLEIMEFPDMPSMEVYNQIMRDTLTRIRGDQINHSIFGDIFLEDLRKYRDQQLAGIGMTGVYPLWKQDTRQLVLEFIELGFKSIVCCVNDKVLDESFVGREINQSFLDDLPDQVDPCGESGEFHSFVYDGPIFKYPIKCKLGEKVHRTYEPKCNHSYDKDQEIKPVDNGFWYIDLICE